MRTFGKVLGVIGIVLLVLVVAGVTFAAWTVHRSYPQTTGTVTLQQMISHPLCGFRSNTRQAAQCIDQRFKT